MEIYIRQRGSIAGDLDLGHVETSSLGEQGKRIEQLVAAVQSERDSQNDDVAADLPRYEITIVDGGRVSRIERRDTGRQTDVVRDLVAAVAGFDPASR